MVQASRGFTAQEVVANCPVCLDPLPPIVVEVDARAEGHRMVVLDARAQELDAGWWAEARLWHPDCIPPGVGAPAT